MPVTMPSLSMSRQATRDFENVRIELSALVSNFNSSVLEILDKYHQCTVDQCTAELGAVKTQLIEKDRELERFRHELDYRTGYIIRLEKERSDLVRINSELVREKITLSKENSDLQKVKADLQAEMEARVMEARKIASFERLDLRPSPTYHLNSPQVESEPETACAHPRDLESVVSRLKKQKNPRHVTRRSDDVPEAEGRMTSVLSQAENVPDLVTADSVVTVTERAFTVKEEEGYDVDDNDVGVLCEKEVPKPDTPTPVTSEGIDTVDVATSTTSSSAGNSRTSQTSGNGEVETTRSPSNSLESGDNETSQEQTSDGSSDAERATNNNDHTFINLQSDQLSLPLKKRKPQTKKRAAKTPEPENNEKPKVKPRRVKALSTDTRPSSGSRSSADSRKSSASVAISEDEITPLPDSTSDRPKNLKRRRTVSLDTDVRAMSAPSRRTTKNSRQARDESDSEMEETTADLTPKPEPAPDPTKQILEIGVVHASNTPILSNPKPFTEENLGQVRKSRSRSRSLNQGRTKQPVVYDCTQCTQSFTRKAQFHKHVQTHKAKKRKIESPVIENNENLVPEVVSENKPVKNKDLVIKVPVEVVKKVPELVQKEEEKKEKKRARKEKKQKKKVKQKRKKSSDENGSNDTMEDTEVNKEEMKTNQPEHGAPAAGAESEKSVPLAEPEVAEAGSEMLLAAASEPEAVPETSVDQNSVVQNGLPEDGQANHSEVVSLDIKTEPSGRDTPSSIGRNTPSSMGRNTPSFGRSTPTLAARRRPYKGPIHRCAECPATFKFKYCLDNHRGVHTQAHTYKCSHCSASFRAQKALSDHVLLHKESALSCLACQMSFSSQDELSAHVVNFHCENPPSPEEMNQGVAERKEVSRGVADRKEGHRGAPARKEVSQVVPDRSSLTCHYCSHVCESKEEMIEHVSQHKNDRSWKCGYCPATFRWKGSLDVHVSRHVEETCPHCGLVLPNRDHLDTHISTEHALKFEVLTGAEAIAQAMGDF